MVRMVWWCGVAAACMAASAAAADLAAPAAKPEKRAEEDALGALKEEHERLARRLATLERERAEEREPSLLEAARRVEVHGFVDGLFSWNTDDPDVRKGANGQRLVDPDHDTLGVPLATLSLVRRTSGRNELDGGFGLTAAYGRLVEEALRDDGLFDDGPLDIPEAYVELQLPTPWRRAFLRAGRTYGFLGAETLDLSRSACVSLSPLAAFGPKTLTGLAVGLELAPGLTYTQWVGNGWDQVIDANDSKTLGGQLRLDAGLLDVTASWLSGAERADSASDRRWIGQVEVGVRPWAGLSARATLMAGEERGRRGRGRAGPLRGRVARRDAGPPGAGRRAVAPGLGDRPGVGAPRPRRLADGRRPDPLRGDGHPRAPAHRAGGAAGRVPPRPLERAGLRPGEPDAGHHRHRAPLRLLAEARQASPLAARPARRSPGCRMAGLYPDGHRTNTV